MDKIRRPTECCPFLLKLPLQDSSNRHLCIWGKTRGVCALYDPEVCGPSGCGPVVTQMDHKKNCSLSILDGSFVPLCPRPTFMYGFNEGERQGKRNAS